MATNVDLSAIARVASHLARIPRDAGKVLERSRATLRRRIVAEARRDIQGEYALPARRVLQGLSARNTEEGVELTGAKRGINVIEFGAKHNRKAKGARWRIKNASAPSVQDGTFIATGRNGNRLVFERAIVGGRIAPRLPIRAIYGPSVAQMLRRPGRADRLAAFAQTVLASEIARILR